MFTSAQIVERYCAGQPDVPEDQMITCATAIPDDWSEHDCKEIGLPAVFGNRTVGFVGAIQRAAPSDPFPWIGESPYQNISDAREEVIRQATRLKSLRRQA